MMLRRLLVPAMATSALLACGERGAETGTTRSGLETVTLAEMMLPVTTASEDARTVFLRGQRQLDLGRFLEANAEFKQAITLDSTFAYAYLSVANTATSLHEFQTNLALAEHYAAKVTPEERILILIAREGFDNDVEGQRQLASELVEKRPDNPRAWLSLASIQENLNDIAAARASMARALEAAPNFLPAHTQLGNSYLFEEPRDFAKAQEHMAKAVDLAPNEPWPHDLLGDAYRAQNNLEQARAQYTRAHELNPADASPVQQRGHVNSFLGDYTAARADYDSSIALGRANEKANFATYRAYVNIYEGNPQAAIDELEQLVRAIDTLQLPEPRGLKIGALGDIATIAIHTGKLPVAEQALSRRSQLVMQAVEAVGTPEYRRAQEANIAYFDAWLAARRGDYRAAEKLTDRVAKLVAPDANPRKMEPVHELKGYITLYQGQYQEAVGHFQQGNPFSVYIKYQLALAQEGAGNAAEAKRLFQEVATYNFNFAGYALVRKEAAQKAA